MIDDRSICESQCLGTCCWSSLTPLSPLSCCCPSTTTAQSVGTGTDWYVVCRDISTTITVQQQQTATRLNATRKQQLLAARKEANIFNNLVLLASG